MTERLKAILDYDRQTIRQLQIWGCLIFAACFFILIFMIYQYMVFESVFVGLFLCIGLYCLYRLYFKSSIDGFDYLEMVVFFFCFSIGIFTAACLGILILYFSAPSLLNNFIAMIIGYIAYETSNKILKNNRRSAEDIDIVLFKMLFRYLIDYHQVFSFLVDKGVKNPKIKCAYDDSRIIILDPLLCHRINKILDENNKSRFINMIDDIVYSLSVYARLFDDKETLFNKIDDQEDHKSKARSYDDIVTYEFDVLYKTEFCYNHQEYSHIKKLEATDIVVMLQDHVRKTDIGLIR